MRPSRSRRLARAGYPSSAHQKCSRRIPAGRRSEHRRRPRRFRVESLGLTQSPSSGSYSRDSLKFQAESALRFARPNVRNVGGARRSLRFNCSSFMVGKILLPEIRDLIAERNFSALREIFREWPPAEIAEVIVDLPEDEQVIIF